MESPPCNLVYGPNIYDKLIPEDHILYKINQQVDFSFVNEACKDLYSQHQGRPVKNLPEIMFRSAIVQYMNNYSDRDIEEAATWRNEMEKLFFIILKQIEDAGFAKGNQSADATHVIANIAIPGTIGLIKKKKLLEKPILVLARI